MTHEELILKVKETKNVEELIVLAKENNVELTEEQATAYFEQLHKKGEVNDDELGNVSGGACHRSVNGEKYTVVTSSVSCFTGLFSDLVKTDTFEENGKKISIQTPQRRDNETKRGLWYMCSSKGQCGHCYYLEFDDGIGYCGKS